jgi:hypothetical protein
VPTGLPDKEQVVSVVEKLEPETVTVTPGTAVVAVSLIDGAAAVTVNVVEAESPPGLPLAVIV